MNAHFPDDDFYESLDPLGLYDSDGDGHYDDDERFELEADDQDFTDSLLRRSRDDLSFDDDFDDDEDDDFDDDDEDDDF